jgi:hypothetical protein
MVAGARTGGRDGAGSFAGTGGPLMLLVCAFGFCCCSVEYLSSSSPMVSLRRERGMRLTRISIRVRRLCAWML